MRSYELTFIIRPDIPEDAVTQAIDQVKNWLQAEGAELTKVEQWGRRRLAYTINDHREGHYVLFNVSMPAEGIDEVERNLKLSDTVLRYLLIRKD